MRPKLWRSGELMSWRAAPIACTCGGEPNAPLRAGGVIGESNVGVGTCDGSAVGRNVGSGVGCGEGTGVGTGDG